MFGLTKQKAKLTSVNPRAELHGDDTKLAVDLKFSMTTGNDVLNEFEPTLKAALYKKGQSNHPQGELMESVSDLPVLKFPDLGPISWDYEGIGYTLTVHYGIDGKSDIVLASVTVDNFKFDCKEGGSVVTGYRIIAHPAENQLGKLCSLIQHDVDITLTPPSAEQQEADIAEPSQSKNKKSKKENAEKPVETDVLYPRVVASVRATKNPDDSAIQTEFRVGPVQAAAWISRMADENVIAWNEEKEIYEVVEHEAEEVDA